jgi:carbonic anhydrase
MAAAVDEIPVKVKWNYTGQTGPAYWGKLNPEFSICANGKTQSPIDVPDLSQQAVFNQNKLTINYQSAPMVIVEDGTTNLMLNGQQTLVNTGHGVQLNFPSTQLKESITYNQTTYKLIQFHLHVPAENTLHGQTFPMEIHFVHQSDDGKIAVIGVLVQRGKANPALQRIVEHLPTVKKQEQTIQGEGINPAELLPQQRAYYSFAGSLTTPPCTEGLQWLLMADTITASPLQIAALKKAADGANARPIQKLNERKIIFNK